MIDCPNGMMRDRLPDLLHGRLDAAERAEVEAHVRGCAECEAELALLAELRTSLRTAPAVNTAAIVAALPAPPARASIRADRTRWSHWRAAAAIALVAGGTSLVVMRSSQEQSPVAQPATVATAHPTESATVVAPVAVARPATGAPSPVPEQRVASSHSGEAPTVRPRELAVGVASVAELSDQELSALLSDMESLDATPSLEVEGGLPVTPALPGKDGV